MTLAKTNKHKLMNVVISEDLLELYPYAKEAILFYETHEQIISTEAVIELRDCLDHLMLAFSFSNNEERHKAEIDGALEHLRRASIEPLEYAVENKLAKISKRYNTANWYRILLIPFARNSEYDSILFEIKNEIIAGRDCKNLEKWQLGVTHFKQAYILSQQLELLTPKKEVMLGRIFAILVSLFFFILGMLC